MTNICLIARDRPRLTAQTLRTLYANTDPATFNLTVVNDGSAAPTSLIIQDYARHSNCQAIHLTHPVGIVGWLKNLAADASAATFGRGEWLYFSDNDVAFFPGWLDAMSQTLAWGEKTTHFILGGYRHPFHGVSMAQSTLRGFPGAVNANEHVRIIENTDAVAGYSQLMRWGTWKAYGPFDSHAKGVCQSEDYAICQKIIRDGGKVGYINPPVLANCGITNSEGKPAIGSESFPRIEGLIFE